ncbi:MAG: hypothetical protein V5B35_17590 [Candidatus Accumulibacter necessarius]
MRRRERRQAHGEDHRRRGSFVDVGPCEAKAAQPARLELTLDLGGGLQLHLVRG